MSVEADKAFDRDVPENLRDEVMTMIAEAAQGWCSHDSVTILDCDRMDAINVRASGIIEIDGEEYTFIVEDGNWNGTVLEGWNCGKEFVPSERTKWALAPERNLVTDAIRTQKGPFLIAKWDAMLARPEIAEIPGNYTYDRMMQPGCKVETYWHEKASLHNFVIVSDEEAQEIRADLQAQKGAKS